MHKFIYAQKDSWISENSSSKNYGGDEVLELFKDFKTDWSGSYTEGVSRILVQFDLTDISSSIVSGDIATNAKYYLNMYSNFHYL